MTFWIFGDHRSVRWAVSGSEKTEQALCNILNWVSLQFSDGISLDSFVYPITSSFESFIVRNSFFQGVLERGVEFVRNSICSLE